MAVLVSWSLLFQKFKRIGQIDQNGSYNPKMNVCFKQVDKRPLDMYIIGKLFDRYYLFFTNSFVYYGLTLNSGSLIPGNLHFNIIVRLKLYRVYMLRRKSLNKLFDDLNIMFWFWRSSSSWSAMWSPYSPCSLMIPNTKYVDDHRELSGPFDFSKWQI